MLAGRPTFMLEVGASGRWDPGVIEHAVTGLRQVATGLGVLDGAPAVGRDMLTHVTERTHLTSPFAGLFRPRCAPGDRVPAGVPLGEVLDVFGNRPQPIMLERDAVVIGVRCEPVVHVGDRLVFIGTSWEQLRPWDEATDAHAGDAARA
jgi:predicted deacylase